MTEKEFEQFRLHPAFGSKKMEDDELEVVETHISYLFLLRDEVFKVKKSVKLPFLDFTDLDKRKHACSQELLLNKRLAPMIYLDVQSVKSDGSRISIGGSQGVTIDFAVRMQRINNDLEMDRMLLKKELQQKDIIKLAEIIAMFHLRTFSIAKEWKLAHLQDTFNQIGDFQEYAAGKLGEAYGQIIESSCSQSDDFLRKNIAALNRRSQQGYVRDVHGDLHSHNIFLTDPPVIFDCIEFDDDLRQIDLLNEIAFFLMDLDFYEASELGDQFLSHYLSILDKAGLQDVADEALLLYFKMYRASVKAKVLMIGARHQQGKDQEKQMADVRKYLDLVGKYLQKLA